MPFATAAPVNNVPSSKLGRMYEEHIQMILDKDIEGLLGQYAEDAVLVSSFEKKPRYFRGHDELREHFQGILAIKDLQTEIAFWAETKQPDTLMVVESIRMRTEQIAGCWRTARSRFILPA
jgi:ketosteroid isomerase-like protein